MATSYTFSRYVGNELVPYTFNAYFDGPDNNRELNSLRANVALRLCSGDSFDDTVLQTQLDRRNSRIVIMSVDLPSNRGDVPSKLVSALSRSSGRIAKTALGFYMFSANSPCVLEYICISKNVHGIGLGMVLFTHFETYVRSLTNRTCRRIYLAAVNKTSSDEENTKLFQFYQDLGFTFAARERDRQLGQTFYVYIDVDAKHMKWPRDTDIMVKELYLPEIAVDAPEPIGNDVDEPIADKPPSIFDEYYQ